MARPIKPTPILKGIDAEKLLKELHKNKPSPAVFQHLENCERIFHAFRKKLAHPA